MTNCCLNFLLYMAAGSNFRKDVVKIFRKSRGKMKITSHKTTTSSSLKSGSNGQLNRVWTLLQLQGNQLKIIVSYDCAYLCLTLFSYGTRGSFFHIKKGVGRGGQLDSSRVDSGKGVQHLSIGSQKGVNVTSHAESSHDSSRVVISWLL